MTAPQAPTPQDPGWGQTLRTSAALVFAAAAVTATFWMSSGAPEAQQRRAKAELADVSTQQAYDRAFSRLVNCSEAGYCVAGTTASIRIGAFWSAAKATGAIRFAHHARGPGA